MARTIVLRIVEPDVSAVADLLDARAPRTSALVWDALPLTGRLVHGMYSGPELFIVLPGFPAVRAENQVQRALPGDVGYWHNEAGLHAAAPEEVAELVFVYDRGVSIKGTDGSDSWVNLFARIRVAEAADFLAVCRRSRTEGPWTLRVERGEDA
jgi:Protein of unknown function (DUF3830)